MLPDVWNVAKPLEVEYRRSIHQSSDQSNSGRKEKVKPPCGKERGSRVGETANPNWESLMPKAQQERQPSKEGFLSNKLLSRIGINLEIPYVYKIK